MAGSIETTASEFDRCADVSTSPTHFRLLHLPQEIQDIIYDKYFGDSSLWLERYREPFPPYVVQLDTYRVGNLPRLDIDLTCKRVQGAARAARVRAWTHLTVENASVTDEQPIDAIARSDRFLWVRNNTSSIEIQQICCDGSFPSFDSLKQLVINCTKLHNIRLHFQHQTASASEAERGHDFLNELWSEDKIDEYLIMMEKLQPRSLATILADKYGDDYSLTASMRTLQWWRRDLRVDVYQTVTVRFTEAGAEILSVDFRSDEPEITRYLVQRGKGYAADWEPFGEVAEEEGVQDEDEE
ncbi:hypothetical protein OHC33_009350 [Knufia fluminis]|uniref:Uncharacterized protein n=1 Tax=Knufia fluminis TaxID=191047 RepID=A0AAN8EPW5_9EURO|nr:hypothetical protein OHC33_009350 [Knufia fluminis]